MMIETGRVWDCNSSPLTLQICYVYFLFNKFSQNPTGVLNTEKQESIFFPSVTLIQSFNYEGKKELEHINDSLEEVSVGCIKFHNSFLNLNSKYLLFPSFQRTQRTVKIASLLPWTPPGHWVFVYSQHLSTIQPTPDLYLESIKITAVFLV